MAIATRVTSTNGAGQGHGTALAEGSVGLHGCYGDKYEVARHDTREDAAQPQEGGHVERTGGHREGRH
jgi:hypothetical protein